MCVCGVSVFLLLSFFLVSFAEGSLSRFGLCAENERVILQMLRTCEHIIPREFWFGGVGVGVVGKHRSH